MYNENFKFLEEFVNNNNPKGNFFSITNEDLEIIREYINNMMEYVEENTENKDSEGNIRTSYSTFYFPEVFEPGVTSGTFIEIRYMKTSKNLNKICITVNHEVYRPNH